MGWTQLLGARRWFAHRDAKPGNIPPARVTRYEPVPGVYVAVPAHAPAPAAFMPGRPAPTSMPGAGEPCRR